MKRENLKAATDLVQQIDKLEKRIHDLGYHELRCISIGNGDRISVDINSDIPEETADVILKMVKHAMNERLSSLKEKLELL